MIWTLILFLLFALNLANTYLNHKIENHKTALFCAFAAGVMFVVLIIEITRL
jgi:hypothetical protein